MAKRRQKKAKIPMAWQLVSWLVLTAIGLACFFLILWRSGVTLPVDLERHRDTLFFSFLAGILLPAILLKIAYVLLQGLAERKSALAITNEVGKEVALTFAQLVWGIIIEALTGGGRSSGSSSSSSGKGGSGGGGSFGGGGASGGF
jgi:uncharacterized membrane protein YgcG